jgi:hypothetical protein
MEALFDLWIASTVLIVALKLESNATILFRRPTFLSSSASITLMNLLHNQEEFDQKIEVFYENFIILIQKKLKEMQMAHAHHRSNKKRRKLKN